MLEARRKQLNAERLELIDPSIRKQVANVIATLEFYAEYTGHLPLIGAEVFRTPAKQRELKRRGVSKVSWGYHCATIGEDGKTPGSLAADIVDSEKGWNGVSAKFWLCIAYAARAQGLNWGGYFGVNAKQRARLIELMEYVPLKKELPNEKIPFGWDVAHVETARVSIAEARKGKR